MSKADIDIGTPFTAAAEFATTRPPNTPPPPEPEPDPAIPLCDTCGTPMTIQQEKISNRRLRQRWWVCKNLHVQLETALLL